MKRPKRDIPDKHPITNIDPVSGVTPTQLYEQAKYLIERIRPAKPLTKHQQQTAINDTVVKVMDMMNRGLVPNKDYEEFKNYLFITLKSACLLNYTQKTYRKNSIILNAEDYQLLSEDYEIMDGYEQLENKEQLKSKYDKVERVNEIIKQLTPIEQSIFNDYINGLSYSDVISKYGVSRAWFSSLVKKIKVRLKRPQPPTQKNTSEISEFERKYLDFISSPPKRNKLFKKNWVFVEKMESSIFEKLSQDKQIDYLYNELGYKLTIIANFLNIPINDIYQQRENFRRKMKRKLK